MNGRDIEKEPLLSEIQPEEPNENAPHEELESSIAPSVSWPQYLGQKVPEHMFDIVEGVKVPFVIFGATPELSFIAGLNAIINSKILGTTFETLVGKNIHYIPEYLNSVGYGNKKIGLTKTVVEVAALTTTVAGILYGVTTFHDGIVEGNIFDEDSIPFAIVNAGVKNPYLRDLIFAGFGYELFAAMSKLVEKIIECCKKPEDFTVSSELHWTQKAAIWPLKLGGAFATEEALRNVFIAYDQKYIVQHFLFPLSVFVVGDQFMSAWRHVAKDPKPFENLVEHDEKNEKLSGFGVKPNASEIVSQITNREKVAAVGKTLLISTLSIGTMALVVYGIDYARHAIDPNYEDDPSFSQRLGEATLTFAVGNLVKNAINFGIKKLASCRMFSRIKDNYYHPAVVEKPSIKPHQV